ncbi:hypothetical protein KOR42_52750 [Thalassoglobus neptunius]|uniref:Uncharacterized protein n=1 Tax=Thalassoglobus neptunius TaxID=1938619 RepID=A0A5C5V901_9PLAN|nr:hypothetical protein [Thalassoglobus neptunius]TWT35058.1 hypothetical protein KOR42_52750 [Thalassoglobus neptunius]
MKWRRMFLFGIVFAAGVSVEWFCSRTFERRVIPRTECTVVDLQGNPIEITLSDIVVDNEYATFLSIETLPNGRFIIPETIRNIGSGGIGDRCIWTFITVRPAGFEPCQEKVGLCNGDVLPNHPDWLATIKFQLAPVNSKEKSTSELNYDSLYYNNESSRLKPVTEP